ncbi:MAG: hypothetical protein JSS41_11110, partial [Proteobacteria bacterium]|nr:hypothetical protein [Pseudomonadota bacterium]
MATDKKSAPPKPNLFEQAAVHFVKSWGLYERAFGRSMSAVARRMRFSFFLTMTAIALAFLFWDYYGIGAWAGRSLQGGNR